MKTNNFVIIDYKKQEQARFVFNLEDEWVITIDKNGLRFNREAFPDWTPDDFANAFLNILEKTLPIK